MLGIPITFFLLSSLVVGLYAVSEYWSQKRLPSLRGLLGLVLLPIGATGAFCCFPLLIPVAMNELRLARFARGLYEYPLPPDTSVVSRHAAVGLMGNGNHCDFIAEQTMRSALTQAELEAYYRTSSFRKLTRQDQARLSLCTSRAATRERK